MWRLISTGVIIDLILCLEIAVHCAPAEQKEIIPGRGGKFFTTEQCHQLEPDGVVIVMSKSGLEHMLAFKANEFLLIDMKKFYQMVLKKDTINYGPFRELNASKYFDHLPETGIKRYFSFHGNKNNNNTLLYNNLFVLHEDKLLFRYMIEDVSADDNDYRLVAHFVGQYKTNNWLVIPPMLGDLLLIYTKANSKLLFTVVYDRESGGTWAFIAVLNNAQLEVPFFHVVQSSPFPQDLRSVHDLLTIQGLARMEFFSEGRFCLIGSSGDGHCTNMKSLLGCGSQSIEYKKSCIYWLYLNTFQSLRLLGAILVCHMVFNCIVTLAFIAMQLKRVMKLTRSK